MKSIFILILSLAFNGLIAGQSPLKGVLNNSPSISPADQEKLVTLGLNTLTFPTAAACKQTALVDICFLIDATSSMSNQLDFIKTSIGTLLEELEVSESINFRTSAVLYRDHSDSFVTNISEFTNQKHQTIGFIQQHTASGGGDYAEALSEGFWVAMQLNWYKQSDQKLLFMFCDAPPHNDSTSLKVLSKAISIAAQKGIVIIPVLGTEADDFTIAIAQYLSQESEGAIVQLINQTDQETSTTGTLYELVEHLLARYADLEPCEKTKKEKDEKFNITVSPNPASDLITVRSAAPIESIEFISAEGVCVYQLKAEISKNTIINTSQWTAGVYFINVQFEHFTKTQKLVVLH